LFFPLRGAEKGRGKELTSVEGEVAEKGGGGAERTETLIVKQLPRGRPKAPTLEGRVVKMR